MDLVGLKNHGLPIVGQPFAVNGMVVMASLTCKCTPGGTPLLVPSNAPAQCPACQKAYVVSGVQWSKDQPQPKISIATIVPPAESGDGDSGKES